MVQVSGYAGLAVGVEGIRALRAAFDDEPHQDPRATRIANRD